MRNMWCESSAFLSSTMLFMEHPGAVGLDNFCAELHEGTSWKKWSQETEKSCISLPPVQFMNSPQTARCLQTELCMHLDPPLPK